MELTRVERMALNGILLKENQILTQYIQPLREELQLFLRDVEERAGLTVGALGTTHSIDYETGTIKEHNAENDATDTSS